MKNLERVAELIAALKAECEYRFEFDAVENLAQTVSEPPRVTVIDERHQEFCGKRFALRNNDGHFFGKSGRKTTTLHRIVWSHYFGEIPKGFAVHHIDHDKSNNNIENLRLVSLAEHARIHNRGVCRAPKKIFVCEYCGKEFEAHDVGANKYCSATCNSKACILRHPLQKTCAYCGKRFTTYKKKTRFCSNSCESRARYADRREERTCPVCGEVFSVPKRSRKIYCSPKCSGKAHTKKFRRTCEICGKEFETIPSEDCRTCSPKCGYKLQSQTKNANSVKLLCTCPICGKEFMTYPSKPNKTCSVECGRKLRLKTLRSE